MVKPEKHRFLFAGAMFGGNATLFGNLQHLIGARDDVEATWLSMESRPKELMCRIPPISLNWTLKGGLLTGTRVRALERRGRTFDAAFFNHLIPPFFLREFRRRVPSVIWMDVTPTLLDKYSEWYQTPPSSQKSPLEKVKYRLARRTYLDAAYLMPMSNWVRYSLVKDYGIPEDKITVVPPGVDLTTWTDPHHMPGMSGTPRTKLRMLFVGGEFIRKGGDLLLKIAGREEFRNCEFHVLTYTDIHAKSENVYLHSNIRPNTEKLRNIYRDSDIFALPSRGDIQPIAILEAMAMRLPVVTTNVGAIGEIIVDGETGYMVGVDDEEALADRLRRLIGNAELRARLGHNARRTVESKFNFARTAETIVEYLIKAAGERHRE